MDTLNEVTILHPPADNDPLLQDIQNPYCLQPKPFILHHSFDALRLLAEESKGFGSNWNDVIFSKRYLDGLVFLGRPLFGALFLGYYRSQNAPFDLGTPTGLDFIARQTVRRYIRFQLCWRQPEIDQNLREFISGIRSQPSRISPATWQMRPEFLRFAAVQVFGIACGGLQRTTLRSKMALVGQAGAFLEAYLYPSASVKISFQSEPVLAGFACNVLSDNNCLSEMLESIDDQLIHSSIVSEGLIGEFVARVLVIKAMIQGNLEMYPMTTNDDRLGSEGNVDIGETGVGGPAVQELAGISRFFSPVRLSLFIAALIGREQTDIIKNNVANNFDLTDFLNGHVVGSHFLNLKYREAGPNDLIRAMIRRNAFISGYRNMPGADILVPVVCQSGILSYILISVKNDKRFRGRLRRQNGESASAEVIRHLRDDVTLKKVFLKKRDYMNYTQGGNVRYSPCMSIVMCFQGKNYADEQMSEIYFDHSKKTIRVAIFGLGDVSGLTDEEVDPQNKPYSFLNDDLRQLLMHMVGIDMRTDRNVSTIMRRNPETFNYSGYPLGRYFEGDV